VKRYEERRSERRVGNSKTEAGKMYMGEGMENIIEEKMRNRLGEG